MRQPSRRFLGRAALVAIVLNPLAARADIVWPALLLEGRMMTWWAIAAGLVAEWPVVNHLTRR
jgi:hypothetical protein